MKKTLIVIPLVLLAGCASYSTKQHDNSYLTNEGIERREISTQVKVRTFFSAKSALANSKTLQTDKTQSANLGSLTQEATAADIAPIIKAISEGIATGLKKSVVPTP